MKSSQVSTIAVGIVVAALASYAGYIENKPMYFVIGVMAYFLSYAVVALIEIVERLRVIAKSIDSLSRKSELMVEREREE